MWDFPLFPKQASTVAEQVDGLYLFLVGVTAFFTLLIFALIFYFTIKYRRGKAVDRSNPPVSSHKMEAVWIIVPLAIAMVIFGWSTSVYFNQIRSPADAAVYHAIAKQWMWKFQNPDGKREVNELHVPVGRAIRILMTSQDVIHDLYIPAFRIKSDILPGRYTTLWFEATRPGTYHLFCAEYCGTNHSQMTGQVIVMEPDEYERWLAGESAGETPAQAGERLFTQYGCNTCHNETSAARGPSLTGLFGKQVNLQSGQSIEADENYIRESIFEPTSQIVAGFPAIMPTFKGQLTEDDVMQLVAYIKSLSAKPATTASVSMPTNPATLNSANTTSKAN